MFNKKIPDYQAELPWKHPERPVILSWHRWAIPRSTLETISFFSIFFVGAVIILFIMYCAFTKGSDWGFYLQPFLYSLIPGALFLGFFSMPVFEHTIFVYRITEEGLEEYSWKEGYKKLIVIMAVTAVLAAIALIVTAIHTQSFGIFFLAFVGPGGMGLMAFGNMVGSKNFVEHERNFSYVEYLWCDKDLAILVDKGRKIISIKGMSYYEKDNFTLIGSQPIYCDINKFDEILAFIKNKYPKLPVIEERAKISFNISYEGKPKTDEPYIYFKASETENNNEDKKD